MRKQRSAPEQLPMIAKQRDRRHLRREARECLDRIGGLARGVTGAKASEIG